MPIQEGYFWMLQNSVFSKYCRYDPTSTILLYSIPTHPAQPHYTHNPSITAYSMSPIQTQNSLLKHLSDFKRQRSSRTPLKHPFPDCISEEEMNSITFKAKLIPESGVWCATGSVNGPLDIQGGRPSLTATFPAASWIDCNILHCLVDFSSSHTHCWTE